MSQGAHLVPECSLFGDTSVVRQLLETGTDAGIQCRLTINNSV